MNRDSSELGMGWRSPTEVASIGLIEAIPAGLLHSVICMLSSNGKYGG